MTVYLQKEWFSDYGRTRKLNQMENSQKDKLFGCNLELHVNFEFTNLQLLSTVAQIK